MYFNGVIRFLMLQRRIPIRLLYIEAHCSTIPRFAAQELQIHGSRYQSETEDR